MKTIGELQSIIGGIAGSKKFGLANTVAFLRSIDFRSEPSETTVTPRTTKISGSVVTDLPMAADSACDNLYFHGNTGSIYRVDSTDTVVKEYTVPDSVGNGLSYFPEDKYLYIPTNTSISRRSNACGTGTYYDNFLETEGGEPTNTHSLSLLSASSQSATRADTASLSITGDLTLEAYIKPTTVPSGTDKMTIISKWDESGALRSYKLDIVPTSASFSDGSDGVAVLTGTDAPIDSACTGTVGTNTLSATNASFTTGQRVKIVQMQGTGAGTEEENEIQSYTAGTITLVNNLSATFTTGAQVIVMKKYSSVSITSTFAGKPWDGTVGGYITFLCSGTTTIAGGTAINVQDCGFRGGAGAKRSDGHHAYSGESYMGLGSTTTSRIAVEPNYGAGGNAGLYELGSAHGSGGSYATLGGGTKAGTLYGVADLSTIFMGSGGGGAYSDLSSVTGGNGARGGGIIDIASANIVVNGAINANAGAPQVTSSYDGGNASGGSIRLRCQTLSGGGSITALGGTTGRGGVGGNGRIEIEYYTSKVDISTPTANNIQDDNLGLANGQALRLYISSTGSNSETYTQDIDNPVGFFNRYSVAWDASASTAYFYQNGSLIGTRVGSFTAIHDNATEFGIGVSKDGTGTRANFYNGLIDDVRIFNTLISASSIRTNNNRVLTGSESGLVAYYKFDNAVTDSQTSVLNDLTANNSPTYSTEIAFSGVSVRGDEDVFIDTSGQTYDLTTGLSEGSAHRQTFTPTKEPLKSIALNVDTIGTGDWTVVVHDALNRELTSKTVLNADMRTGIFEFIFASSSRPVLNASYHVHVYSTVADGSIVSGTASDMEGAYLKTFFQVLVSDQYHPIKQFLNLEAIGNERYLAVLEAGRVYNPHRLIFPSGYRVRALAPWRDLIAIGTWKGDDVTDTDSGKIFFWDGTASTYFEPLEVPQGAINALHGSQGKLTISAGYEGRFFEYTGGEEANPLFTLPNRDKRDMAEIAPNAITMYRGLVHFGATLSTDSSTIHQGIYSYGKKENQDPRALGFDYPLSIGDQTSSSVKIGCLFPRSQKLYAGFQNGNSYGIDVIDVNADPYPTATIEYLISDLGSVPNLKQPLVFRVDFLPLTTGQSVAIKYKPDRATAWLPLATQSTVGATDVSGVLPIGKVKEVQFAVDITSTTTAPIITSAALEAEDYSGSKRI